jgi:hypothetical protein
MDSLSDLCLNQNVSDSVAHPLDSRKFLICTTQRSFQEMSCPTSLVYNIDKKRCDNYKSDSLAPCFSNPCQNGASCTDLPRNRFSCHCSTGFSGEFCEEANACSNVDCGSNGVCRLLSKDSPLSYYCSCYDGLFFGTKCDYSVEENPCINGLNELYPTKLHKSLYIQCQGSISHIKNCLKPLVFSEQKQDCDWPSNIKKIKL